MPELPEVETTLRGIRPHLEGRRIERLLVREPRLRQPVAADTAERIAGTHILGLERRSKYLLLGLEQGSLLIHLGMSGSLRILDPATPPRRHDHIDLVCAGGPCLRMHDPRRFGLFLWTPQTPLEARATHPLLRHLGPEPLTPEFDGDHLHRIGRTRRIAVKSLIMDASVVVGVGNIYANESLFLAGIHPTRPSNRISLARYRRLAETIRAVLEAAIEQGGTTLRDFLRDDGQPGYFAQSLRVYGRGGQPCRDCATPLRELRIAQRSTVYCPRCQR
ncbi:MULTISPECIES: bifunctional DNA-formamidopyrimidine glycosylase/DNA-(apurinic or apyrimidinic site) lyase [unclassified Marichromatium]|uniref:bifunctional DNA-formamidopyrimidine glycosylase/DNA-(apurinic or apyrimidinic site) lyase n=1 Tax=unclassified Marichromatium TaxID=2618417 RepID=UPI000F3C4C6D|nr:bifunctional DNA-formamidopyrimidine glycosylase/DNA-(apurinic or apyrimidinic site) lyase [Marichromatium sp. AB31]RNE92024.1 bifunctional DNA-formamidopyrimidine glycosylase/DNA-(apurinic or apyrimidinic site) lyase [Marichromatium sp. AB31]